MDTCILLLPSPNLFRNWHGNGFHWLLAMK